MLEAFYIMVWVGMLEFAKVAALNASVNLEEGFVIPPTTTVTPVADVIAVMLVIVTTFETSTLQGWLKLLTVQVTLFNFS